MYLSEVWTELKMAIIFLFYNGKHICLKRANTFALVFGKYYFEAGGGAASSEYHTGRKLYCCCCCI